jgi:hypothetical protein
METITTYRGRNVTASNIAVIKEIIAAHPEGSRRFISQEVCRTWDWRQANGRLKDMVCRSLLLLLQSQGWIQLPPPKCSPSNPLANRQLPVPIKIDQTPIRCSIGDLFPIHLEQVRRTPEEKLCNSLISQYHYLDYTQPVGEHLKYMAFFHDRPIACLVWSSAPWYIGVRDRFIGWNVTTRKKHLHMIAYQNRFLILPWVQVPHLASHLLAKNRRCLSRDWERIYAHPVHLLETFVDTQRFQGTCYKADNWICVGQTTGRGKLSKSTKAVLPKKAVYLYPLSKDFRQKLHQEAAPC